MVILNKADCEKINTVVDYICEHYGVSVGEIKKKFGLTTEEYDMISDLMMPAIRYHARVRHLETGIRKLIRTYNGEDMETLKDEESDENENLRAS